MRLFGLNGNRITLTFSSAEPGPVGFDSHWHNSVLLMTTDLTEAWQRLKVKFVI
jgi:hypothetical protein